MRARWEYFGKERELDGFQGVLQLLKEDVGMAALQFSSLRDDTDDDFMMKASSIVCLVSGWGTWKTRAGLSLMAASPQPPACTCTASSEQQFFSQVHHNHQLPQESAPPPTSWRWSATSWRWLTTSRAHPPLSQAGQQLVSQLGCTEKCHILILDVDKCDQDHLQNISTTMICIIFLPLWSA